MIPVHSLGNAIEGRRVEDGVSHSGIPDHRPPTFHTLHTDLSSYHDAHCWNMACRDERSRTITVHVRALHASDSYHG